MQEKPTSELTELDRERAARAAEMLTEFSEAEGDDNRSLNVAFRSCWHRQVDFDVDVPRLELIKELVEARAPQIASGQTNWTEQTPGQHQHPVQDPLEAEVAAFLLRATNPGGPPKPGTDMKALEIARRALQELRTWRSSTSG